MLLADKLQAIADGKSFYEGALYDALYHPVTTSNDKQMLHRYMHGSELLTDKLRLEELVIYINEYESNKGI